MQMNYKPIGGKWSEETTRWCRKMLKEGNVYFLGSDMHDVERENRNLWKLRTGWKNIWIMNI